MFARRTEWPLERNALTRAVELRRQQGAPILDLTESNPTRCGFRYDSAAILEALARPASLLYQPEPRGPLPARQAVAAYYAERGAALDPAQIFLTASTSEAYSYLFRLLADPGDAVLAPQPSYPLFDFLGGLNDLEIIPYPLVYDRGWRIDLSILAARLERPTPAAGRARALLLVHPNNPTGSFVHQEELPALVELCRRHELALIADEVFADYAFSYPPKPGSASDEGKEAGPRHTNRSRQRAPSFASLDSVLSFTLSGLSKIAALPQMKAAWIVVSGPPELRVAAMERLEIIADTYLSVNTPVALALPELLETRGAIQPQIMARLLTNLTELDRQLSSTRAAARLETEGGWYATVELSEATNHDIAADDFAVDLARQEGVVVHPGHFYDFASEGHLVLSLLPPAALFAEGVAKLLAHLTRWVRQAGANP